MCPPASLFPIIEIAIDKNIEWGSFERQSYPKRGTFACRFTGNWSDPPPKTSQKDTDARWAVKHNKANAKPDGRKPVDFAIPVCGYKTHISITRSKGSSALRQIVATAAANDSKRLYDGMIDPGNTCRDVRATRGTARRGTRGGSRRTG